MDKITITDSKNPAIIFTKSGLTEGDVLLTNESKVLTVKVEYSNNVTSQPESTESSIEVTLDFSQNDGHIVTQTVYRWTTDRLDIGDSIEGIETTTDPTTLGKNHFLKHEIVNNKIQTSEACFIKDGNTYCLKPNEYEISEAKLFEIFGERACNVGDSVAYCIASGVRASAYFSGTVHTGDGFSTCGVDYLGHSECSVNKQPS